jgi:hypothetical protein
MPDVGIQKVVLARGTPFPASRDARAHGIAHESDRPALIFASESVRIRGHCGFVSQALV